MAKRLVIIFSMLVPTILFAASGDDAVKRLEGIASNIEIRINESPFEVTPPDGKSFKEWYRRKIFTLPVSFDARTTNSLVSPIVGEVVFGCNIRAASALSEAALKLQNDEVVSSNCKASYAFQSSRWIFKSLSCDSSIDYQWEIVGSNHRSPIMRKCLALLPSE